MTGWRRGSIIRKAVIVPVWRTQNLVTSAQDGVPQRAAFLTRDQIAGDPANDVFLGQIEDRAYFARDLSAVETPLDLIRSDVPLEFADLRRVGPLVGNLNGSLMAFARGIFYWHSRHGFCGVCGAPTRVGGGGPCPPLHQRDLQRAAFSRAPIPP